MKEYKRKKRSTDLVQELSAGQYNFEYILNPIGEQQRLEEQKNAESQIQLKKPALSEDRKQSSEAQAPAQEAAPHTSIPTLQIAALAALVALLASAIIYALVRWGHHQTEKNQKKVNITHDQD